MLGRCLPASVLWTMPKIARSLSAIEVSRLKAPGFVSVGGVPGLALQITPTGARSWVLRVKIGSSRHDIGLGAYPGIGLAQARQQAASLREQIAAGSDPLHERMEAKARLRAEQAARLTFREAAERFIERKTPGWSNPKSAAQWRASLETHAYPLLGALDVRHVEQHHVEAVLEPIWTTKTETASRVRGRIESILSWCIAGGHRTGENPARWRGLLEERFSAPARTKKVQHHPAVPIDEAHAFWCALRDREGLAARALEFALLTAARSGEVRGAQWGEIDIARAVWTIPAERMKAKREHRVPLSATALDLLRSLPRMAGTDLVFPGQRGGPLSDMSLSAVMKRMEMEAVPHGLRSTFRDWAGERTSYPRDLCEQALAHVIESKAEAAYRRGDALEKRRGLMEAWAKFLQTPPAVGAAVVSIVARAA